MSEPIHIISLGAGVQSSTMALMAAAGEITPTPTAAIFADTQAEPGEVYNWLAFLRTYLPFPVHSVTAGSLEKDQTTLNHSKDGKVVYVRNLIPAFTNSTKGEHGMLNRSCTRDFKVHPLQRFIRGNYEEKVILWIGISLDEAIRMKESRVKYIDHRWPLIEARMSRHDCLTWLKERGFPQPPKSACIFCPYHNNRQWREIKANKTEWERVVAFEKEWNRLIEIDRRSKQVRSDVFLHSSLKPISEVDFSTEEERGQLNMFNNECEGMCGV